MDRDFIFLVQGGVSAAGKGVAKKSSNASVEIVSLVNPKTGA